MVSTPTFLWVAFFETINLLFTNIRKGNPIWYSCLLGHLFNPAKLYCVYKLVDTTTCFRPLILSFNRSQLTSFSFLQSQATIHISAIPSHTCYSKRWINYHIDLQLLRVFLGVYGGADQDCYP